MIFRDEFDKKHFVVRIEDSKGNLINDPNINGLKLSFRSFRLNGNETTPYIDLECYNEGFLEEFSEVIKEIAKKIVLNNLSPSESIQDVILIWKCFWSIRSRDILSEEKQVGLICELIVLNRLCVINPSLAMKSWKGPIGERHDFVFTNWIFEVKGTRRSEHVHIINGIDQLKAPQSKYFGFISFILTSSETGILSVQTLLETIVNDRLRGKGALITEFYGRLADAGYSIRFAGEYRKLRFDVVEAAFFRVDDTFPKFTSDYLKEPLNPRVSNFNYQVNLQGLNSQSFDSIKMGDYLF
jgi:hypothetical protein